MAGTSYWDIIVPIVAAWVSNKYGNPQGDTPNQYPAVLPPEVKRMVDEAWNVYKSGGSPIQQDIRNLAIQSAAQTPSEPSGFQFMSQELRGQPFAGGIKAPKYDVSKLNSTPGNAPPPGPIKPPTYTPRLPPEAKLQVRGPRYQIGTPDADGASWGTPIADQLGGGNPMTPADRGRRIIGDDPGAAGRYGPTMPAGVTRSEGPDFQAVADAWNKYKTEHPNWAKLGAKVAGAAIGAMTGLPGLVIGPIITRLILKERPPAPAPPNGQTPGYIPPGGSPSGIVTP